MVQHNHIKTHVTSLLLGFIPALIYLLIYTNGYLGTPIVGWELLSALAEAFFHPVNIIGLIIIGFVMYKLGGKTFYLTQESLWMVKRTCYVAIGILTAIMAIIYLYNTQLAGFVGFFYFLLVGYTVSYYFVVTR